MVHSPRGGRAQTRILYWFRTPPGVRVGRSALDAEAMRLIEAAHPDVRFDWPQILRGEEEPLRNVAPPARAEAPPGSPSLPLDQAPVRRRGRRRTRGGPGAGPEGDARAETTQD